MKTKLGLGVVTAAMLAYAGSAQAVTVDYTGLAFNSLSGAFSFTRLGDEPVDFLGGGILLTQAGSIAAGLGQANYSVTGTSIDAVGGLLGGSIDFGTSTTPMAFGPHTMSITGGHLDIKVNNGAVGPTVTLPFGLGSASPDYELENGHLDVLLNGVAFTFSLCEEADFAGSCSPTGDDEPWEGGQPYNTLNVGDDGGTEDLAMFLYFKGNCADESCPFYEPATPDQYFEKQVVGYVPCSFGPGCDYRPNDGISGKSKKVYDWVPVQYCDWWDHDCNKIHGKPENKDIYLKIALWGQGEEDEVPEPATLSLFGLGLIGLGAAARRRRQAA